MTVRLPTVLLILVSLFGEPCAQELYRWVDDKGIIHFADSLHSVPEKYRRQAEKRSLAPARETPAASPQGAAGPTQESGLRHPEIPFIHRGKQLLVEGMINQRVPVTFFVDAGAAVTTIPASIGAQLGINLSKGLPFSVQENRGAVSGRLVTIDSLRLGEAEINDFEIAISEHSSSGVGFLGSDFLGRFHIHVDYESNRMELAPGEGAHDGRPPEWWQERFRFYRGLKQRYERDIKRLKETYYNVQQLIQYGDNSVDALSLQRILDAIKVHEGYVRVMEQKISELDRKASDAAVPRNLRE